MSIESMPEGQPESSIINLPKTVEPEIGGGIGEFSNREIAEKKNQ